jgi:CheY-like chemotaxis protein
VRVLVVEDERFLAEALQTGLRRQGMAVDIALDGEEALRRIAVHESWTATSPASTGTRWRRSSRASTRRSGRSCSRRPGACATR